VDTFLNFNPPVIAHRGASSYAPENTMASFIKAAQLGVKWVEFDVMLTAAKEAVVFHDETLSRTTNGKGAVGDYNYVTLSTLDAGSWFSPQFSGERIPLLSDVLQFLKEMKMAANIEIKSLPNQEESTVKKTLDVVHDIFNQPESNILFSSFSVPSLQRLRLLSSDCQIGLLIDQWEEGWEKVCQDLNCVSVHVNEAILTPEKALKIKEMGKMLLCYTVNDPARAKALYALGVDAVFTDVPDQLLGGKI
jgi:glycerophosphoryl diester phosphodiesterase